MSKYAQPEHKATQKEKYIKIPEHILAMSSYGLGEKVLYAYIYGFGEKGCYDSNEGIAKLLHVNRNTVKVWLSNINSLIYVKSPKSKYRTLYAKDHPKVTEANKLWYRNKSISKSAVNHNRQKKKEPALLAQILPSTGPKSIPVTGPKSVPVTGPKSGHYNTTNKKKNNKASGASPQPVDGQASAPRKKTAFELELERKRKGGFKPIPDKEFRERRQKQIAALRTKNVNYG